MRRRRGWIAALLVLFGGTATAYAQDDRSIGLVITSASTAGLIWHVTETIAIRPEVSFATSDVEVGDQGSDVGSDSGTFAVAALFTVRKWDDLSAYFSPRFSYVRSTATSSLTVGSITDTIETSIEGYGLAGSFGLQYRLGDRFAVFGETGLSYTNQTADTDSPFSLRSTEASSLGLRTALGVSFYF
jgi:hypothetical protein